MRRLGWFLVGAAGATGALVAAPGLYGRLRAALGGGDPWNELEPEPEWGVLREPPPVARGPEPVAEAEPEPEPEPEPPAEEAVAEAEPAEEPTPAPEPAAVAVEPEPEPEPEAEAEPEPAAEAPAEPDAYETSIWSTPAPVAPPAPAEAEPAAEAQEAEPADEEPDDDTAEIPAKPLTPGPPPEDTAASDLRSRIEASRARLHRKAQAGGAGDDEPSDEPDEPDASA